MYVCPREQGSGELAAYSQTSQSGLDVCREHGREQDHEADGSEEARTWKKPGTMAASSYFVLLKRATPVNTNMRARA